MVVSIACSNNKLTFLTCASVKVITKLYLKNTQLFKNYFHFSITYKVFIMHDTMSLNILEFRKEKAPSVLQVRKYYKTAKLGKFSRALLENVKGSSRLIHITLHHTRKISTLLILKS